MKQEEFYEEKYKDQSYSGGSSDSDYKFNQVMKELENLNISYHTFTPKLVLERIKKALKKGGYLVITLPNDVDNLIKLFKTCTLRGRMIDYNSQHIRFFNTYSIKRIAKETGFKILKIRGYGKIPFNRLFPNRLSHGFIAILKMPKGGIQEE